MMIKLAGLITISLVAASCLQNGLEDTLQAQIIQSPSRGQCSHNSIHVSQSGRWAAISDLEERFGEAREFNAPFGFLVYDIAAIAEKDVDAPMEASIFAPPRRDNPPRLIPIGWDGEAIVFRIGANAVGRAQYEPETKKWSIDTQKLDPVWRKFRIQTVVSSDLAELDDSGLKQRAQDWSDNNRLRRRTVYLHPGGGTFSAVDVSANQALLLGTNADDTTNLGHANFFWRFRLGLEQEKLGNYSLGHPRFSGENRSDEAYGLAAFDQNTGERVGWFSPTSFQGPSSDKFNAVLEEGNYLIRDVVVSGERTFVLAENDKDFRLLVGDDEDTIPPRDVLVCVKGQAMASLKKALGAEFDVENNKDVEPTPRPMLQNRLQPEFSTTGAFFRSAGVSRNKLALYYHGGPTSSAYGFWLPHPLRELQSEGYDVLAVEYSGSVGGGLALSRSLQTKPSFGFKDDAIAVKRWIEQNGYSEVVLYAVSFGAAPAMVFQQQYPKSIRRAAYLGPLLKMPATGVSEMAGGPLFENERGSQIKFEVGVFGSVERRAAFVSWLEENAAAFDASKNDLFVFGEMDQKTPMSSAPANITDKAQIVVIPKTNHQFLGSKQTTQDLIARHLAGDRHSK